MIQASQTILAIFCPLFLSGLVQVSANWNGSVVVDEVTSIYDGDTFRVNINAWPDIIGYRVPVRLNGIDW